MIMYVKSELLNNPSILNYSYTRSNISDLRLMLYSVKFIYPV